MRCGQPLAARANDGIDVTVPRKVRAPLQRNESGAGYRGRTGIFEVLRISPAIEDLVMRRASVSEIRLQAYRDGMRTLREAALAKVIAGDTSLAEVLEHTVAVDTPLAVPA